MPQHNSPAPLYDFDIEDEVNLQGLWRTLARRRWLIAGFAVAGVVVGALVTWLQRPSYESYALVRVVPEERGLELASASSSMQRLFGLGDPGEVQTSVGILQSRLAAETVVDSLALQVELLQPRTPRGEVVRILSVPRKVTPGVVRLERENDGTYRVRQRRDYSDPLEWRVISPLPSRVRVGEPFQLGPVVLELAPELREQPARRVDIRIRTHQRAVERLQQRITVTQPRTGSQLVRVESRGPDPYLSAEVPNIIVHSFIDFKNRTTNTESSGMVAFLREQTAAYRDDLRESEDRLQAFREQAQIVEPKSQAEEQAKRLVEMQAERESLWGEREALSALLRELDSRPTPPDGPSPYRELVAFPSFISNGIVQRILDSIIRLEDQRSELLVRRSPVNTDVQALTQRIGELEGQLYRMGRNYLDGLDRQIGSLDASLGRFSGELARLPAREVELRRQMREYALLEEVYQMVQTKLKEEEIRASAEVVSAQLVDRALVPEKPSSPKPLLNLVLAGVLGLLAGAGTAIIRERSATAVASPEDVRIATGGLPVLASVPLELGRSRRNGQALLPAAAVPLISSGEPVGQLADAYRTLRSGVALVNGKPSGAVLVVAGGDADDGSAAIAANLAITYAQQGTPVVLVDCDLRAPSLHALFGTENEPGLAESLTREAGLADAIRQIPVGKTGLPLHLLTAGVSRANPADLVGSDQMAEVLTQLRTRYRAVILAVPPINLVPDAGAVIPHADRTLLVARAGATPQLSLQTATARLRQIHAPVAGVVLNHPG
ncbi:MAG: polysaccharide biosynthesis tyrosine autokinase [Gemmatimonadetes bacterium]|nr:polysaccharide biosynthesis tyrosine autokinase [Gemmatimonadota bacterium]